MSFTDITQTLSASVKQRVHDAMMLPKSLFVHEESNTLENVTASEQKSMGEDMKGMLVVGQEYTAKKAGIKLYRAWNGRNPRSRMGHWWTLDKPDASEHVDQYRKDYNICYQWSGLDSLVVAELKEGAKVVVGAGQSAECSPYAGDSYPVSTKQQVYIDDPKSAFVAGSDKDLAKSTFGWDYAAYNGKN